MEDVKTVTKVYAHGSRGSRKFGRRENAEWFGQNDFPKREDRQVSMRFSLVDAVQRDAFQRLDSRKYK